MTTATVRSQLRCEELESRANPTNVAVSFSDHTLYITADSGKNIFTVQENLAGAYAVTAGAGTLVNGRSADYLGVIDPTTVEIRAGNGQNNIAVYGVKPSVTFSLVLGSGNDFVNLSGVTSRYVNVNLGGGENTLETTNVVAQNVAAVRVEGGPSTWYDTSFRVGQYLVDGGWSQIVSGEIA